MENIAEFINSQNADICILQEVDQNATRTYHFDEREFLTEKLAGYSSVWAENWNSPFLFYPFIKPHGSTLAGIMTFSMPGIASAFRISLPIETGLMKLVDLDRCYSVSRIPVNNGRELVLYNLHLSAYTSDGKIAEEQMKMLIEDMSAEYGKGNYVIGGGDFNKDLLGDSAAVFGVNGGDYTWAQPIDPAVRTPSVWGNGGDVDVISQWTYSYPDPIKVGEAADELFAMAEGNPGQKVMKMTQVIWYRDRTAPVGMLPKEESLRTEWEKDVPDAKFVTIAPDHLSIALWSMLARPVRGIMYHGWYSLVDRNHSSKSYYKFTNGESAMRLKALTGAVVKPLGPMLLEVGDRQADVAMLESFSSQIYASCGSWGWSDGWESDVHLILQWAGYQPRIVYEETIRKNGLDAFRVLVMPNCEVLPQDIVDAIHDFQKKGGIVVGDRLLCPAIVPDYTITRYNRTKAADKDKEKLQELSKELRKALDPYLPTPFRTSNMDLVGRMRRHGTSDYLFVMNDRRTYGDYVGQYRLVMEKGLPNAGRVSLARTGGFVYDLVKHIPVKTATSDGLSWDVELGPGEGGLYLATSTALEEVRITAPEEASRGGEFSFTVAITDKAGKLSDAVVPLRVDIATPEGETEGTGYYAAVDGFLEVKVNPAKNDMPGAWTIRVQDLASGNDSAATVQVK